MKAIFIRNWGLKLVSILLACIVWWLIRGERERNHMEMLPLDAPRTNVNHETIIEK